jgi:hypothetical protein
MTVYIAAATILTGAVDLAITNVASPPPHGNGLRSPTRLP